ncbi:M17 family peptidase N-terminal domain-containing protein [Evansella sp. AB-P1]|uniref:M17 family peptidase N-terminal domain-containing protein n=1 Tax=Evansella sp. AB-P1 TaxID=3037653 RepID=UPI00241C38B9|nr:M17 family peptidase N-terminal domain-containing protein [Evansella sp. AB-P1]MDG5788880.1 M17 family peptidase N-terminal domain-containing protein [Evansella sp. AB-P1]
MIHLQYHSEIVETNAIVIGLFQNEKKSGNHYNKLDELFDGQYTDWIKRHQVWSTFGAVHTLPVLNNSSIDYVVVVGLGHSNNMDSYKYEEIGLIIGNYIRNERLYEISFVWESLFSLNHKVDEGLSIHYLIYGVINGISKEFEGLLWKEKKVPNDRYIYFIDSDFEEKKGWIEEATLVAKANLTVKELVGSPQSVMSLQKFIQEAQKMFQNSSVSIDVFTKKDLDALGLGGILCLSSKEEEEVYLLKIEYNSKIQKVNTKKVAFIGSGVIEETKHSSENEGREVVKEIRRKKLSGASILGIMQLLVWRELEVNAVGLIPLVKKTNGSLMEGDIIRTFSGNTVKISNSNFTDWLPSLDAATFASMEGCDVIVNLEGISSELELAIGDRITAVMTNNDDLKNKFDHIAHVNNEAACFIPLKKDFILKNLGENHNADYINNSGELGRPIQAACLIGEFIKHIPWITINIARKEIEGNKLEVAGSGNVVKTIVDFINLLDD